MGRLKDRPFSCPPLILCVSVTVCVCVCVDQYDDEDYMRAMANDKRFFLLFGGQHHFGPAFPVDLLPKTPKSARGAGQQ